MDEDWRNACVILMCTEICDGACAGAGIFAIARHRLALVKT